VHGYQSNRVRAETAALAHLTYGFEINQALRLDGVFDFAQAQVWHLKAQGPDRRDLTVETGTGEGFTWIELVYEEEHV
jgi:restriction endonuclease